MISEGNKLFDHPDVQKEPYVISGDNITYLFCKSTKIWTYVYDGSVIDYNPDKKIGNNETLRDNYIKRNPNLKINRD